MPEVTTALIVSLWGGVGWIQRYLGTAGDSTQIIATWQGHLGASHCVLSTGGHEHANDMQIACNQPMIFQMSLILWRVLEESEACQPRKMMGTPRSLPHTADRSSPPRGVEVQGRGGGP